MMQRTLEKGARYALGVTEAAANRIMQTVSNQARRLQMRLSDGRPITVAAPSEIRYPQVDFTQRDPIPSLINDPVFAETVAFFARAGDPARRWR